MIFVLISLVLIGIGHFYLYLSNPYARYTIFKSPYTTYVMDGKISYTKNYSLRIYSNRFANWLGYYKSGCMILLNTFFGASPAPVTSNDKIIQYIHQKRFDPTKPYIISGDQFSVLYVRNLGVFYNQLLNKSTALDSEDWNNRLRIYLQSVLIAIDGLSASKQPRTTIVPIGRRCAAITQVHPGSIGSDQVYGLLYALKQLQIQPETQQAVNALLDEKKNEINVIVENYIATVIDPSTGLIDAQVELASARDGVIRHSSFYDNVILWKTMSLARDLGIYKVTAKKLDKLQKTIKSNYWNEPKGYYNDDRNTLDFSADWLIGFVTDFFDLEDELDQKRTQRTIAYIERSQLIDPLPIKYQNPGLHKRPLFVRLVVPGYGDQAIWSYWGAQYITLLIDMYRHTKTAGYRQKATAYCREYEKAIIRDRGFAETFDQQGRLLRTPFYKSILITGWVVQYEHVVRALRNL